ncbi:MAG TPA: hypothetical protein VNO31_28765 [Umezawaea sp.]|nr:hypothetical protein [Umezawaea sp.]
MITVELAELLDRTGLSVLDHLEKQVLVPVIDGLQAQGDLIVIPLALLGPVRLPRGARWDTVPSDGVELVRAATGNNPHTLTADPHTCHWTTAFHDPLRLGVAIFDNTTPAYLVHPEHGATGIAPGTWLVRRQQERSTGFRSVLVVD